MGSLPIPPADFPGGARGWVFYDGFCPICAGIVSRIGPLFQRRGFRFVPLQDPWVGPALGVSGDELRREMKLHRREGSTVGGVEAWKELGRAMPWLRPLVVLSGWPGIRRVADAVYRWIAANRYCLAGVCPAPDDVCRRDSHHGAANTLELP
ncbi:MAG: DUF393 domain-containing protein [Verrucomicrobia bacterium]|nr:DUF393 domain-containing protein [Verrucomicrobiota bacterium]